MKKNDWFILLSGAAYSYLFYEQSAGLNFFIFEVLITLFCFLQNAKPYKDLTWIAAAIGNLTSGFAVFYFGNLLTVYANVLSVLLLVAFSFNTRSSLFIALANSFFSLLMSVPGFIMSVIKPNEQGEISGNSKAKKIILFLLPFCVVVVFFLLYRESNPLFEKVTDQINFDFISIDWLFFTFFGFVLMYGFFNQRVLQKFFAADEKGKDELGFISEEEHQTGWVASIISRTNELFTGVVLFAMLNLLLLSVNGVDIYYLYIIQHLPDDLTLSQYLHDGTNALIVSIIFAIGIILFYFRGRLNFSENTKTIRFLAYIWIAQNIFLIITTAKRNFFYVSNFGLTHKRIGVYIFLALCIIGLITTFIKILKIKSSWFLFRKNSWVWYSTLLIASFVNWDAVIAKHNLELAESQHKAADAFYLGDLSYTSLSTLFEFYAKEKGNGGTSGTFNPYLLSIMKSKYDFMSDGMTTGGWQSACLLKIKAKKEIATSMKDDHYFFPIKP